MRVSGVKRVRQQVGIRPLAWRAVVEDVALMKVIHLDSARLVSPGRVNGQVKEGKCKKTHPDMATDDEADAEQAIEEQRGRAGGHKGNGSE